MKILAIKRWFPFKFAKTFKGLSFYGGLAENFFYKTFDNDFQEIVLASLMLLSCACY